MKCGVLNSISEVSAWTLNKKACENFLIGASQ